MKFVNAGFCCLKKGKQWKLQKKERKGTTLFCGNNCYKEKIKKDQPAL
jgi:hypothetical protein